MGSGSNIARPVATSYGDMTSAMMTEMAAQLARMGQLAIDVEHLKTRNALLEAELAQVHRVRPPSAPNPLSHVPALEPKPIYPKP